MKKLISLFRQVMIVSLVALTVFVMQYGNSTLYARAEAVTPEATSYQSDRTNLEPNKANNPLGKVQESLKETAENVREKLNLDEPLDPGTKEVLNSAQENVEKTVKPITGKEQGTYQQNTR